VPDEPQIIGALGAALIAQTQLVKQNELMKLPTASGGVSSGIAT
jgi:hypothetical protein